MMGGRPARNMQSVEYNKEHYTSWISLVIQNTHLAMQGSMNVKFKQEYNYLRMKMTVVTHVYPQLKIKLSIKA